MNDDCRHHDQEVIAADKEHVDEVNSPLNRENMETLQNSAPSEGLESSPHEDSGVVHEVPTVEPSNGLEASQVSIPPVISSYKHRIADLSMSE